MIDLFRAGPALAEVRRAGGTINKTCFLVAEKCVRGEGSIHSKTSAEAEAAAAAHHVASAPLRQDGGRGSRLGEGQGGGGGVGGGHCAGEERGEALHGADRGGRRILRGASYVHLQRR